MLDPYQLPAEQRENARPSIDRGKLVEVIVNEMNKHWPAPPETFTDEMRAHIKERQLVTATRYADAIIQSLL